MVEHIIFIIIMIFIIKRAKHNRYRSMYDLKSKNYLTRKVSIEKEKYFGYKFDIKYYNINNFSKNMKRKSYILNCFKHMDYQDYIKIKYKIDNIYEEYKKEEISKDIKNETYVERQNNLINKNIMDIYLLIPIAIYGICTIIFENIFPFFEKVIGNNIISINIIFNIIVIIICVFIIYYIGFNPIILKPNKYYKDIEQYEIDLIDKILKEEIEK